MAERRRKPALEEDTEQLFRRYRKTLDPELRDQIICRHLYLAQAVAKRFVGTGESPEDVVSEGVIGLIQALDDYDLERGVKFTTYATHRIDGRIRHYLRDLVGMIRQPAWVQELGTKITRAQEALTHALGRRPTPREIAQELDIAEGAVETILEARDRTQVVSLDAPLETDSTSSLSLEREPIEPADAPVELTTEDRIVIEQAKRKLKELERKALDLYQHHGLNQTEISRRLGISVNYASYLLRNALGKVRQVMADTELPPERKVVIEAIPAEMAGATTDPLTGLLNESYFALRVRQEAQRAQRYPATFSVMLFGLRAGQDCAAVELLQHSAPEVRKAVRRTDLVARLGDDVIGLLLLNTGRQARVIADRLGSCIRESCRQAFGDVSALCGLAIYPEHGSDGHALLDHARTALEAAREQSQPAPATA